MKTPPSCGDLRRSSFDTTLNSILLVLIVLSYLPQVYKIVSLGSTLGIATNYVLFNYLFTATQFTTVLLLSWHHYPVLECIRSRELRGLDGYGACLGLVQITAQWLGSASMVALYIRYPNSTDHLPSETAPGSNESRLLASLCISHLVIWVLPAIWVVSQPASQESWGSSFFAGLCDMICIPVSIVLVCWQFFSQGTATSTMDEPLETSALSLWTLAIQAPTFFSLGLSWMYRLGPRGKGFNRVPDGIRDPLTWYLISSWPYVNNIIFGVGQGVLLVIHLYQEMVTTPGSLFSVDPIRNDGHALQVSVISPRVHVRPRSTTGSRLLPSTASRRTNSSGDSVPSRLVGGSTEAEPKC